MKLKRFEVVELENGNKATILDIKDNEYFAEIVDRNGKTIENRNITENEIKKVIIYKDKLIWLIPGTNHNKNNGLCQEFFL